LPAKQVRLAASSSVKGRNERRKHFSLRKIANGQARFAIGVGRFAAQSAVQPGDIRILAAQ
jgi:hypothetical protein